MIKHKINQVPDEMCLRCKQQHQGSCRAFLVAHTDEEYEKRLQGGALCEEMLQDIYIKARKEMLKERVRNTPLSEIKVKALIEEI